MIVCVCRNIKESDYETREELINRLSEVDVCCGQCVEYCQHLKDHTIHLEVAEAT
jgi:hypothetical protein